MFHMWKHRFLPMGLTWHNDVREAQFARHGHSSAENQWVFSSDLLDVSSQQLQGDDQT